MNLPLELPPCDSLCGARRTSPLPVRRVTTILLALSATLLCVTGAMADDLRQVPGGPYDRSRLPAALAKPVPARALPAGYPPAAPQAPPHTSFPALASPGAPAYPPVKGSGEPTPPLPACGVISDCSFEGGAVGWFGGDLTSPLLSLGVYGAGINQGYGLFTSAPTDGVAAVMTGWDGDGPGEILVGQDVILQPNAARLEFDYRAGWNIFGSLARTFRVEIQPSGGGAPLLTTTILTAPAGTNVNDTGNLTGSVDIRAFAGQPVRILFIWFVPEYYTGPAAFQLDHIRVREDLCQVVNNCSFETGTLASWATTDLSSPLIPVQVAVAGTTLWTSVTTPTDGGYAFVHGWDGNGPGDIQLFQDVVLPSAVSSIEFDYRAYWNNTGSLPRTFALQVQPSGGGAPLASQTILTAPGGTNTTAGPSTAHVDLRAFAGAAVRLVFTWHVPENYTGPADFQLDHIRLTQGTCASIDNCSFETGAFPGWTAADLGSPFVPMQVIAAGASPGFGLFATAPADGALAMVTGFDGDGPGVISLHQDVTIPLWADLLRFDYRAGWDMLSFSGSTRPRICEVAIEPSGGGAPLASDVVLVAPPGTQTLDTGPHSRTFPVAAYAGQPVRIAFRWRIPEFYTGPAFFQLDRVMFDNSVLAVGPGGSPGQALALRPAMPNPSRESATFALTLPQSGDVELEIVDVRGARVWSERHAGLAAGAHRLSWDGVRAEGGVAPAGVYYARVRTPAGTTSRMFVRVR